MVSAQDGQIQQAAPLTRGMKASTSTEGPHRSGTVRGGMGGIVARQEGMMPMLFGWKSAFSVGVLNRPHSPPAPKLNLQTDDPWALGCLEPTWKVTFAWRYCY